MLTKDPLQISEDKIIDKNGKRIILRIQNLTLEGLRI
jgi:hypothetical protein